MAYSLENKPNVDAPDSDYPYGKIRDNNGSGNGTPVNTLVYGDFHQFFAKLMAEAGISPNELPDSDYSGFQLFESLDTYIRDRIFNSEAWAGFRANAPQFPDSEQGVIMSGCVITPNVGTPANFDISEGIVCLDGEFFYVPATVDQVFPMFIEASPASSELTQLRNAQLVSSVSSGQYVIIAAFHVNNRWNMPWTTVTLSNGWTGTLEYRIMNGLVEMKGSIDGSAASNYIFSGIAAGSPAGLNCIPRPEIPGAFVVTKEDGSGNRTADIIGLTGGQSVERNVISGQLYSSNAPSTPSAFEYFFDRISYRLKKWTDSDV